MQKFALAAAISVMLVGTASAADMAVKAAPMAARPVCAAAQWSGFYLGVNGGAAGSTAYRQEFGGILSAGADEGNSLSAWGGTVGGQVGYNVVNCSTFWGIEVDGAWLSNERFVRTDPLDLTEIGGIRARTDGLVTLRGRAGVALDNMLLYVTGGAAAVHTNTTYSHIHSNNTFSETANVSDWTWGWVAGVGAEWAFAPNWSVRSEFLYVGTPDRDYRVNSVGFNGVSFSNPQAFTQHDHLAIARVGINYRFNSAPVVAKY